MTHTYQINGMTCNNCTRSVKDALSAVEGITSADVTLNPPAAVITMKQHIPVSILNKALASAGKYSIGEEIHNNAMHTNAIQGDAVNTEAKPVSSGFQQLGETVNNEIPKSFFAAYKPILIVFGYLAGITILSQVVRGSFNPMTAMNVFMGGFFLVFSFFKLLDLKGFAYSYSSYDIAAKKWLGWGFIYPFIELALGLAYLFHFDHTITNITTIAVMGISSVGVIQSLLAKKKIQCACLGTVFNLPMSNITLIEDLLMVVMAAVMLLM